jgi:hypothetical protein
VKRKKKRRKSRGKKVTLPSNIAPITIVPHESESNMLMEDDDIEYDVVMPTICCDDCDWEDNDVSYSLENHFGTCLEDYDNTVCHTIGAIHAIDKNDCDDMQDHKLWDAMFDEYEMFEDLFAENNACPKLGDVLHNDYDPLIPSTFDKKIYYDDSMPPIL